MDEKSIEPTTQEQIHRLHCNRVMFSWEAAQGGSWEKANQEGQLEKSHEGHDEPLVLQGIFKTPRPIRLAEESFLESS